MATIQTKLLVMGSPLIVSLMKLFLLSVVLYFIYICVYRLYLCPAAGIPGPFLAKITFWPEFYYDVICRGQYVWKIKQMHAKYGPIVRINPDEVHIEDADYYDNLYTGATRKRDKWHVFARQTGWPESSFGTTSHELHRVRRAALSPFFSKAKVRSLQPLIDKVLDRLAERFTEFLSSGEPLSLSSAYAAVSNDIIMEYAFGWSLNRIDAPDFDPSFKEAGESGGQLGHFIKQMPWLLPIIRMIPDSTQEWLYPKMAGFIRLNRDIKEHVFSICSHLDVLTTTTDSNAIFPNILYSSLPKQEKSPSRLWQDAAAVVVAGTLTTSTALSVTTFYLLSQPATLRRLKLELECAIPNATTFPQSAILEQLPYLTGVIKEGLRIANGVSTRLPRVPVDETLTYTVNSSNMCINEPHQYKLLPGTPVSMTGMLIHMSPTCFRDPTAFRPERWIEDIPSGQLEKYLVPFSRGTRQCVGANLAYAELYISLAKIFRQFGSNEVTFPGDKACLQLFETVHEDIEIVGDGNAPMYRPRSKGVRVKIVPNCL